MRLLVAAALGAAFLLPHSEGAVTLQCIPRDAVFDRLKRQDGQQPAHAGVASAGALFEILVGPDGGWTAFFTFPDGLTCPIATGEGWRSVPAGGDGDPAA